MRRNVSLQQYYVIIELSHLTAFDEVLATQLSRRPVEIVAMLEESAKKLARHICNLEQNSINNIVSIRDPLSDFQVQINSNTRPMTIRELESTNISKFVRIPGIVISTSNTVARPTRVHAVCRGCGTVRFITVNSAFGGVSLPRSCNGPNRETDVASQPCPMDPYVIVAEKSKCVDQQTLKIQESPDMVPIGELPRHVLSTVDRFLVNKVTPGTRVIINGVYSIFQSSQKSGNSGSVAIRSPFIRVLGIQLEQDNVDVSSNGKRSRQTVVFSEAEEREMIAMSRIPDIYNKFISSIAPSIFGNEDVKKAIACLLFGGSRKLLPDKMRIRGDINVLLLGDPGVAKSQFLKFVEKVKKITFKDIYSYFYFKVSPISVYTSGKGSSAAGLTASVIKDPSSGDFYLEGGAMVLADGGVVCIDEFDKMNDEDRVAIHEAMEQQTISIAKAGITTILNSRAAVLAAANPIFGRYDEMKAPGENIDFSTTILSRFDMIFILKDDHNVQKDITLARHVLGIHMNANSTVNAGATGDFDLATMKNYIRYCKSKCAPRLSAEAAEKLSNHYVSIRSDVQKVEANSSERSSIPITVRQLEAIIRISEALAKMSLSPVATEEHVDESLRLFKVSTMQAVLAGHSLEGMTRPDLIKEIDRIEKVIRQRLPIGASISYRSLVNEMVSNKGFPEHSVNRALEIMVQQEKLMLKNQRKVLLRQR